jgi:uncharacterized protein
MYFPPVGLWLILGGVGAGVLAGLLGIGGGVVLFPLLTTCGYTPLQAVATSSLSIVITSISGSIQNWRMGVLDFKRVFPLGLPALLTAQIGVYFAKLMPSYLLLQLLGILFLVNIYLVQLKKFLIRQTSSEATLIQPNLNPKLGRFIAGGVTGIIGGLFGLGGGAILVPLQMLLLLEPIKIAVQTSLGVIIITAISTCAGHAFAGNLLWTEGTLLGIGGIVGAQVSTRVLPRLSERTVSLLFRSCLGSMSGYIFWQAWHLTQPRIFLFNLGVVAIVLTMTWFIFTIRSCNLVAKYLAAYSSAPEYTSSSAVWRFGPLRRPERLLLALALLQSGALFWGYRSKISCTIQELLRHSSITVQQNPLSAKQSNCEFILYPSKNRHIGDREG